MPITTSFYSNPFWRYGSAASRFMAVSSFGSESPSAAFFKQYSEINHVDDVFFSAARQFNLWATNY